LTHFSNTSSNKTVKSKHTIPNIILAVNEKNSSLVLGKATVDPIKASPNHAAEKLIENPDIARNHAFENLHLISLI
jgi:hypothetical protein